MVYHEVLDQWPSNRLSWIDCSAFAQFRDFLSSSWRLTYPKWPKTAPKHPFSIMSNSMTVSKISNFFVSTG